MEAVLHGNFLVRSIIACALVFILAALAVCFSRMLGLSLPLGRSRRGHSRIAMVDMVTLQGNRRLILVRRDHVEHLLCIGGEQDLVIESDIKEPLAFHNANIVPIMHALQDNEAAL